MVGMWGEAPGGGIICPLVSNSRPDRNRNSPAYVPRRLFRGRRFPPHCSGSFLLYSRETARKLARGFLSEFGGRYSSSRRGGIIHLENVYLKKLGDRLGIEHVPGTCVCSDRVPNVWNQT